MNTSTMPRPMLWEARVVTKGVMPSLAMAKPLKRPTSAPVTMPPTTPSHTFTPDSS